MKILIITLVSATLGLYTHHLHATELPEGHLTIEIEGIQQQEGQAIFVLMASEASHTGKTPIFRKVIKPVTDISSRAEFDLPQGDYSAVVYHDQNNNGKLDTGLFGKPVEPYGFSNNARSHFGIPDFEASRFEIEGSEKVISINVK